MSKAHLGEEARGAGDEELLAGVDVLHAIGDSSGQTEAEVGMRWQVDLDDVNERFWRKQQGASGCGYRYEVRDARGERSLLVGRRRGPLLTKMMSVRR